MDAGRLLRAARREAGLSQRQLAAAADIGRRVVEEAEAGRVSPPYDVVARLLAVCGQELVVRGRSPGPVDEAGLTRWLKRSLSHRLAMTCGQPYPRTAGTGPWADLVRLGSRGPMSAVEGPLAYGAWLPDLTLDGDQPLVAHAWRTDASGDDPAPPLRLERCPDPPARSLVRVPLPWYASLRSAVLVPPPDALLATAPLHLREALRRAAQLLHEDGPRDGAGRRPAAHREPDAHAELQRWRAAYSTAPPVVTDARDWRLAGAGSLTELARRSGAQPWPTRPGWSRVGWR